MNSSTNQSSDLVEALANKIAETEAILASVPGSHLHGCVINVTQLCSWFQDDPTDHVRLRYGPINDRPGERLYLEVSDRSNEVFYQIDLRDEAVPVAVQQAVARQLPVFLQFVTRPRRTRLEKPTGRAMAIDQLSDALERLCR